VHFLRKFLEAKQLKFYRMNHIVSPHIDLVTAVAYHFYHNYMSSYLAYWHTEVNAADKYGDVDFLLYVTCSVNRNW
jgi:hypothetical protein